jgi:hypothetical protein
LFAGTSNGGIWRRPLSEVATSVENSATVLPGEFRLGQNYPNPFNPSTTIRYDLPKSADISLKVYDVLGGEVATLAEGRKDAGSYQVQWNPTVASGIYFVRLRTGGFVETKKMLLLR